MMAKSHFKCDAKPAWVVLCHCDVVSSAGNLPRTPRNLHQNNPFSKFLGGAGGITVSSCFQTNHLSREFNEAQALAGRKTGRRAAVKSSN